MISSENRRTLFGIMRAALHTGFGTIPAVQICTKPGSPFMPYSQDRAVVMHPVVAFLLNGLALYAVAGVVTALAFVTFGIKRVQPSPVSLGARILILPGAAALWPYVLTRWLKAGIR
jgi:hypothetical protein